MSKQVSFFLIAMDGPSGAGKSSVAKQVASKLNFCHIDTGAYYRAITWEALRQEISFDDEQALVLLVQEAVFELDSEGLILNKQLLRSELRLPEVSKYASMLGKLGDVRAVLCDKIKESIQSGTVSNIRGVVVEGRDIGTVLLPDADLKIFITASVEARARRRWHELISKGIEIDWNQLLQEIIQRDEADSTRIHAPLKQAKDATLIDTTELTFDEAVEKILDLYYCMSGQK